MSWLPKKHWHKYVRVGTAPNGMYKDQCECGKVLLVIPKEWVAPVSTDEWEAARNMTGYTDSTEL